MKNLLITLFITGLMVVTGSAQNNDDWSEWFDSLADKIECLAERVGEEAGKHAEKLAGKVEDRAEDFEAWVDERVFNLQANDRCFYGDGAFLGVFVKRISTKKAAALGFDNPYGSYVSGIVKGTAAEKAGLMPFDYIFGIDEYRTGENQSLRDILLKYDAGDEAVVHFFRKGKKMKKDIIFLPKDRAIRTKRNKCEDPFLGIIEVEKKDGQTGVVVKPVHHSTAEKMGLQAGDVITHINGFPIYDWTDAGIAINMLRPGDVIKVTYIRDGVEKNSSEKIMSYAKTKNCNNCDCSDKDLAFAIPEIKINVPDDIIKLHSFDAPPVVVSGRNVELDYPSQQDLKILEAKGINMDRPKELQVTNLQLSPNLTTGMFDLRFELPTGGHTVVRAINPTGRIIYEYDLGRFTGAFFDHIDFSRNGPGPYFLQIRQDGASLVRKVILK